MMQYRCLTLLLMISFISAWLTAQDGFSDKTRALYILDISRYIEFDESFAEQEEFLISLLDKDDQLYWELDGMARTRKRVQDKAIRILLFNNIEDIEQSNVVFVNSEDDYNMDDLLGKIRGKNTLLISEGYPFRTSMINFVAIEGKPRFEANEELMNQEGLHVNELFLAQAVKTREDWEALYEVTEEELEMEKNITEQQYILIDRQLGEISAQEALIKENDEILARLREEIAEREKEIGLKTEILQQQAEEIEGQKRTIKMQVEEVHDQKAILTEQEKEIEEKESAIAMKEQRIKLQDQKIVLQAEAIQKQKIIIAAVIIALVLVFGLVYFIWINYRNKKKANILLEAQRDQITYQKKHITDSIEYAKRIQTALLPSLELFSDTLEHFVLFKPRDIVSGDFYWVEEIDGKLLIIAADCTGHGVPGAFMSMLGVSLLNEIILNEGIVRPDQILNVLRKKIIIALKQETDSVIKDGMDMTVCLLDLQNEELLFSGANNPLYLIRDGELTKIRGDKMPVAIHEVMDSFALHKVDLRKGDTFYTFSDGYADQFGGPLQKKFLIKNFRELLVSVQNLSMIDQGKKLDETFEDYRKDVEQVDDVVIIGVKY